MNIPALNTLVNNHILFYDTQLSGVYKLIDHLKRVFTHLEVVKTETEYFDALKEKHFDLIICSLDVAPMDGIAITKETIHLKTDKRPFILVYSAKQDDFLLELAFNSGVDSFLNANNSPVIFELIIRSLLKRIKADQKLPQRNSELFIDEERHVVIQNDNAIELPRKEFKLLNLLYTNHHKFFSKKELAQEIWKDESIANKRTIDVHIYNIRQIFGKKIIQSQKGKGYRINKKYFA